MRKVISVFAALALVGSIAAQKGKKAAKPAAPAVAAPKAPAIPAVVTAAPAAVGAAKGVGLFVEGFGSFTLAGGTSTSRADGDLSAANTTYKLPNPTGFGGGASIGYQILNNLGLVASFQYRQVKSTEWSTTNTSAASLGLSTADFTAFSLTAGSGTATTSNKRTTMVIGLGIRPSVAAGPGSIYVGAGAALVLPYDDVTSVSYTGTSPTATQLASGTTEKTVSYNLAVGGYAELGYNFNITDNLYIGIGGRMVLVTANDKDKTTVTKITGTNGANSVSDTTTTTGSDSVPTTGNGTSTGVVMNGTAASRTTSGGKAAMQSQGTTDFSATVTVGFRF